MIAPRDIEEVARLSPICICGARKSLPRMSVCWDCFKYRKDVVPLKYSGLSYAEWVKTLPEKKHE